MNQLYQWSEDQYSHLPWRKERTLYRTLVSEIMLQQTTVGTVLNHFERFLMQYPSISELAKASEEEVCVAWKGLGYYRRARNLLKAAKDIQEHYEGDIPLNFDSLISIHGIGEYTANAILSIGADQEALAIDANLERVLARFYNLKEKKGPKLHKLIREKFQKKDFKIKSFRAFNEALMDVGRIYCQANKAECNLCPLNTKCLGQKRALEIPIKEVKKKKFYELELLRLVIMRGRKVLVYQKSEDEWLAGQYELPTFVLNSEDKGLSQYPALPKKLKFQVEKEIKQSITKYKIQNKVSVDKLKKSELEKYFNNLKFIEVDKNQNLSSISFKVLNKIL